MYFPYVRAANILLLTLLEIIIKSSFMYCHRAAKAVDAEARYCLILLRVAQYAIALTYDVKKRLMRPLLSRHYKICEGS